MTREEQLRAFKAKRLAAMDRVRCDGDLSGSIRTVAAELFARVDFDTGYAWPSVEYLVEKLKLSPRTVKMAIKAVQEHGYFEVRKEGRKNLYFPIFDAAEKVQSLHLSETEQVQSLHLLDADRGKKRPEQVQKMHPDRCKKGPATPEETPLKTSGGAVAPAGAPDGAGGLAAFEALAGTALRGRLGEVNWKAWLSKLSLAGEVDGVLMLSAPSKFIASYVKANFEADILRCTGRHDLHRIEVRFSATAAAATMPDELGRENPDARWLVDIGIDLVSDLLEVKRDRADEEIRDWLIRCGRDPSLLRSLIVEYARRLRGKAFRGALIQRAETIRQGNLKFGPEDRTRARSAS